jgi:hypothetical protein
VERFSTHDGILSLKLDEDIFGEESKAKKITRTIDAHGGAAVKQFPGHIMIWSQPHH